MSSPLSNPADARGLMRASIDANDPVIFIENILCYGLKAEDPGPGYRVPLGKAAIAREGTDISLITYGRTVLDALAVADDLAKEGISVEVIDLQNHRSLRRGNRARIGAQDRPRDHPARSGAPLRHRRGNCREHSGKVLGQPQGPGAAHRRDVLGRALRQPPRTGVDPAKVGHRRTDQGIGR
jgi:hypothetical protein